MPDCSKCKQAFKGWGDQCGDCRKAGGKAAPSKKCEKCGHFFSGFGNKCEDCHKHEEEAHKAEQEKIKSKVAHAHAATAQKGLIESKAWDGDGVPLEDSNVANIGSAEDKALRKHAAGTEPAWKGAGMAPGLWIWRIEAFKVVPWPKAKYGKFHEGDSYICLNVVKDTESAKLIRDIHFWLGKKTSTDEKGTAAYKTVELDDFFDGEPTQHRETQGNESRGFLDLFPDGVVYLPGGVESGFNAVQQDVFTNRLYQVRRGVKKNIVIEEENVTIKILNHRDCFILESGRKIYVWNGDNASPFLKTAANTRAEKMEAESEGEKTVVHEVDDDFWKALGGKGPITPANAVPAEVEPNFGEGILYSVQVDDKTRALDVKEVGRADLKRSMLDTTGVMLLDNRSEIYLWLGNGASEIEKRIAFKTATNYLRMNKRNPDTTAISILKENSAMKNAVWAKIFSD